MTTRRYYLVETMARLLTLDSSELSIRWMLLYLKEIECLQHEQALEILKVAVKMYHWRNPVELVDGPDIITNVDIFGKIHWIRRDSPFVVIYKDQI